MHTSEPRVEFGRGSRWFIGATSTLLLFAPALALLAGGRGRPIENRAPVALTGLDRGWSSLSEFGRFLNDRIPLRANAIHSDAWIDENIFREDPAFGGGSTPRVIRGRDGVLFLADALDTACSPNAPVNETVVNLARLAQIISDSGRKEVVMVAPDKSTIHPELLPGGLVKRACFSQYNSALWAGLRSAVIPGFVDLKTALTDRSKQTRELLYLRTDSHWDSAGSLVAVEKLVNAFTPGLWHPDEVHYAGLGSYTGDLTGMSGRSYVDQAPSYQILRSDVHQKSALQIDALPGGFNKRYINEAPPGRLIRGRTLVFIDSYGLVSLGQYLPYFEDLTTMLLVDFDPDRFAQLIKSADNVWIMSVERSLGYRLSFEIGSKPFLDKLETTLKS